MLLGARNIAFGGGWKVNLDDIPYVTNGIVSMWDGIWNVGVGVHDASASTWTDLITGRKPSVSGTLSFGADKAVFNGSTQLAFKSKDIMSAVNSGNTTVECTCLLKSHKSFDGPFMFAGQRGIAANGSVSYAWDAVSYLGSYVNNRTTKGNNVLQRIVLNASSKTLSYKMTELASKAGILSGSFSRTSGSTNSDECKIGYGYSACMTGHIHGLRFYNRSLSNSELELNYNVDMDRLGLERSGYVFNKTNSTFTDTNGVISGFKNQDTRDWVGFDGTVKWSDFSNFKVVVKCLVGSELVRGASCTIISRRYDDASNGIHEVGAPTLWLISRDASTGSVSHRISWNAVASDGTFAPTQIADFNWPLNTWFYLMYEFTGSEYNAKYSEDGTNWTTVLTYASSRKPNTSHLWFGTFHHAASVLQYVPAGSQIDMNETYIVADGNEWWRGRIS